MKWWQKTIVYECYPKSFLDTEGKGTGTLQGIIRKLDHLESLGVGALWLTPVYKSPMVDNGYDVEDYYEIDPLYGSMADMEELIEKGKQHDIKIVMDLVFNHSSDQCAWFRESKTSRDNPKSDWYIWADPKKDGSEPNNWRSIFGGSAWTWCEERKQYYLHSFASAQPDLNWENPEVRKALYEIARFWVDKGVGGFRIDAISYIKKPSEFTDGIPDGKDGLVSLNGVFNNTEGILDFLHEFRNEVCKGRDIFTVGETNGISADMLNRWVGEDGVFDMIIEFTHISPEFQNSELWYAPEEWKLSDLKKNLSGSQYIANDLGWYPIYFENHDKPRCVDHYFSDDCDKKAAAKLMAVLTMSMRGTPFIYQGQEIGMSNVHWQDIEMYRDICSYDQYENALDAGCTESEALRGLHRYARDNARTPMQWNDSKYAGFSTIEPWIGVNDDYHEVNVEREENDPDSVLNFYRRLNELRHEYPCLIEGRFISLDDEDDSTYFYERRSEDGLARVLLNFTDKEIGYDCKLDEDMEVLICSNKRHEKGRLQPLEAVILYKDGKI